MLDPLRPDTLNPPAIIVQAFDEARALEEIKTAVERRDEAKGEFKDAILTIGRKLIEARRAMPGSLVRGGNEAYSAAFLAFIEKCGLAYSTARQYMSFARNPAALERIRAAWRKNSSNKRRDVRRRTLEDVQAMLRQAVDLDDAIEVINEELRELTA